MNKYLVKIAAPQTLAEWALPVAGGLAGAVYKPKDKKEISPLRRLAQGAAGATAGLILEEGIWRFRNRK